MHDNQLVLSGRISRISERRYSPVGVPITQLVLEHHSTQFEAGYSRTAQCRIAVLICGTELHQQLHTLQVDHTIRVQGFISRANNRQGEARLVLHAAHIELI
jgi:primosomal replication protein N